MLQPRTFRLAALLTLLLAPATFAEVSDVRMTPIVKAVRSASPSVVNIQGQKTVTETTPGVTEAPRQVNGMGTGVVIDSRGYILTNHHVVDGVRIINVTLDDRRTYTAQLIAHDRRTDLAVIKVRTGRKLPTIALGGSQDLMAGETVVAVGNAFGYEHTVTQGIISALHRDVQVSETQAYEDLIQTDASINPGNSGGPLLSIEGRMIGVNVAVRAGAQGIGFAIPVDKAMQVAASMMSVERLENKWHGLETVASDDGDKLIVSKVRDNSPADRGGFKTGDVITRIAGRDALRPLDVELALLGKPTGSAIAFEAVRGDEPLDLRLALARRGQSSPTQKLREKPASDQTWEVLGVALKPEPRSTFVRTRSHYRGGMRVVGVREGGPADQQGIRSGDILVGMHKWETASVQDIRYIVSRPNLDAMGSLKFFILRGQKTLYGHLNVASRTARAASSTRR